MGSLLGWSQEKSLPQPGIVPHLESVQFFTNHPENVVVWPEGQTLRSKNPIVEINQEFKVPGEESIINIPSTQKGLELGQPCVKDWESPVGPLPQMTVIQEKLEDGTISSYPYYGRNSWTDVLSIHVDPIDLFSDSIGIFVPGNSVIKGEAKSGNFYGKGRAWEREAEVYYFSYDCEKEWHADLGIRAHGDLNRAAPQKSFRLYWRDQYGDRSVPNTFFPEYPLDSINHVVFKSANNSNNGSHFTDVFIYDQAADLNVMTNRAHPIQVFINGEYWGIYHMRMRLNAKDFGRFNNVPADSMYVVDHSGEDKEIGPCGEFNALVAYCRDHDLNDDSSFEELKEMLNIESAVDYVLVNTWFANQDWINNNVTMWKVKGADHKWQYVLTDLEASMLDPERNMFNDIAEGSGAHASIVKKLMESKPFRDLLNDRYRSLCKNALGEGNLLCELYAKNAKYSPIVTTHRTRWTQLIPLKDWVANVRSMENFILLRSESFEAQLAALDQEKKGSVGFWVKLLLLGVLLASMFFVKRYPVIRAILGGALYLGIISITVQLFSGQAIDVFLCTPQSLITHIWLEAEVQTWSLVFFWIFNFLSYALGMLLWWRHPGINRVLRPILLLSIIPFACFSTWMGVPFMIASLGAYLLAKNRWSIPGLLAILFAGIVSWLFWGPVVQFQPEIQRFPFFNDQGKWWGVWSVFALSIWILSGALLVQNIAQRKAFWRIALTLLSFGLGLVHIAQYPQNYHGLSMIMFATPGFILVIEWLTLMTFRKNWWKIVLLVGVISLPFGSYFTIGSILAYLSVALVLILFLGIRITEESKVNLMFAVSAFALTMIQLLLIYENANGYSIY